MSETVSSPDENDAPEPPAAGAGLPVWLPFLVIVLAWAAHGRALTARWVHEDPVLVGAWVDPAGGASGGGTWRGDVEAGAWRPLSMATLRFESGLWRGRTGGLDPFRFHLANLFLHGLAAWLLLNVAARLVRGTGASRAVVAGGAAVAFAIHPMFVGAVGPVGGRADLLGLVFSLGSVWAWVAGTRGAAFGRPLGAVLALLALLSNEAAVGLPLVLAAVEWALRRPAGEPRLQAAIGWLLVVLAWTFWFVAWPGPGGPADGASEPGFGARMATGLEGMGRAAVRLAAPLAPVEDPADLAVRAGASPRPPGGTAALLLAVALSVAALVRTFAGRAGPASSGWLLFLLAAIPAAATLPAGGPLFPGFAYATGAGLFAAAGLLASGFTRGPRPLAIGGLAAATLCLGYLAFAQGGTWHDEESFQAAVLADEPSNVRALVRRARGTREEVEAEIEAAKRRPSTAEEQRRMQAHVARRLGAARALLDRAVESGRGADDPEVWRERGFVLKEQQALPDARLALERALRLDRDLQQDWDAIDRLPVTRRRRLARTFFRLGEILEATDEREAAAPRFETASRLDPANMRYAEKAGLANVRSGRYAQGLHHLLRARDLAEDDEVRARIDRAIAEARKRVRQVVERGLVRGAADFERAEYRSAAQAFEEVLAADPYQYEAYWYVAWVRGMFMGDYRTAFNVLDDAEARMGETPPSDPAVREKLVRLRKEIQQQRSRGEED